MQTSTDIAAIAEALATAQGEIENVSKDGSNPQFKSKYATLAAVLDGTRPILAKHGIAIIQGVSNEGAAVVVTTRLLHKSGQWIECSAGVVPGKPDAQGLGSAVTYLRRYTLAAMVCVAQEDDDGNAASALPPSRPANTREAPTPATKPSQPAQVKYDPKAKPGDILALPRPSTLADAQAFVRTYGAMLDFPPSRPASEMSGPDLQEVYADIIEFCKQAMQGAYNKEIV